MRKWAAKMAHVPRGTCTTRVLCLTLANAYNIQAWSLRWVRHFAEALSHLFMRFHRWNAILVTHSKGLLVWKSCNRRNESPTHLCNCMGFGKPIAGRHISMSCRTWFACVVSYLRWEGPFSIFLGHVLAGIFTSLDLGAYEFPLTSISYMQMHLLGCPGYFVWNRATCICRCHGSGMTLQEDLVNLIVGVKMARCVKLQRLKELKTQRLAAWKQFFHGIPWDHPRMAFVWWQVQRQSWGLGTA